MAARSATRLLLRWARRCRCGGVVGFSASATLAVMTTTTVAACGAEDEKKTEDSSQPKQQNLKDTLPAPPAYVATHLADLNYRTLRARWPADAEGMSGIPRRSWPDEQPCFTETKRLRAALKACLTQNSAEKCSPERFLLATALMDDVLRAKEGLELYRLNAEFLELAESSLHYMKVLSKHIESSCTKLRLYDDADSLCAVGQSYQYGTGVPHNDKVAAEYYLRAAEKGHDHACYAVGAYYYVGDGWLNEDETAAMTYFARAARRHAHAGAMFMIADMLLEGAAGLEPDRETALRWLLAAGDRGHRGARSRLFALLLSSSSSSEESTAPQDDVNNPSLYYDPRKFTDASRQTLRRRKTTFDKA